MMTRILHCFVDTIRLLFLVCRCGKINLLLLDHVRNYLGQGLGPYSSYKTPNALKIGHRARHLFIRSGYFYSAPSSPLLLRDAPDTARILCRSFTPKRHRQLRVKDLPKVFTWRLERDSNPRSFESTNEPPRPTVIAPVPSRTSRAGKPRLL